MPFDSRHTSRSWSRCKSDVAELSSENLHLDQTFEDLSGHVFNPGTLCHSVPLASLDHFCQLCTGTGLYNSAELRQHARAIESWCRDQRANLGKVRVICQRVISIGGIQTGAWSFCLNSFALQSFLAF